MEEVRREGLDIDDEEDDDDRECDDEVDKEDKEEAVVAAFSAPNAHVILYVCALLVHDSAPSL